MNVLEYDKVLSIARRYGISFDEACNEYMLHGDHENMQRTKERSAWNAEVEVRKQAKREKQARRGAP